MKRLLVLLFFVSPCFAQQPIPIQNPSFESGMSGWVITPLKAYDGNYGSAESVPWPAAPDGTHVASIVNATIAQDLKVVPKTGVYVLKFFRANSFYSYPTGHVISLTIGGKPICPQGPSYPLGDFTEITIVCEVPGYIAVDHNYGYSGNLGISVSASGPWWPLLFDNVSLTFTPSN